MEIHELPSGTLANEDVLAVDNGANTRKLNFKNIVNSLITEADLTDNPVAFTSGDAENPTEWSNVSVITTGSTLATLFNRISTMVKNVRWLYSKLGTTDISSIGGGTVTGAISALNGNTIKSILVVERAINTVSTSALNAHSGKSLTALGGTALTPNVPTGYTFIGNVNITVNGQVGVTATFDGTQATSQSVVPFIFNGSNNNISAGANIMVRMYSLCYKN